MFFIVLVGGPLYFFYAENESALMIRAFNEVSDKAVIIHDPIYSKPSETNNQKLIFFHVPSEQVQTDYPIVDHDFGLSFSDALSVKRQVEFCQWIESSRDETVKNRDGSETTVRTYYYTKGMYLKLEGSLLLLIFFTQFGGSDKKAGLTILSQV